MLGPAHLALEALESILSSTDHEVAFDRFLSKLKDLYKASNVYWYKDVPHFFKAEEITLECYDKNDQTHLLKLNKENLSELKNGPTRYPQSILLPLNSGWQSMLIQVEREQPFLENEVVSFNQIYSSISQVLSIMEHTKMYQNEIEHRMKIERENKSLQSQLVDSAYKEGLAENAVSVIHNMGNIITPIYSTVSSMLQNGQERDLLSGAAQCVDAIKSGQVDEGLGLLNDIINELQQLKSDQNERLNVIMKQAQLMSDTISLQQKYANMKKTEKTNVDMKLLVNDVVKLYAKDLSSSGVKVTIDIDFDEMIQMDANGMHYLISNAILNCCESIMERSAGNDYAGKIDLSMTQKNDHLIIKVMDNGMGINKDIEHKLFQFGSTSKDTGNGFGLHNMANFVTAQKGKINLCNRTDCQGAMLTVTIPMAVTKVAV